MAYSVKRPVIDEVKLGKNPLTYGLRVKVNKLAFKNQYKKDKEGKYVSLEKEVEYTPICKLYILPDNRKEIALLSARAKELLMWIMYEVDAGKDYLWVNKVRYMDEMSISSYTTYSTAVNELMGGGFVSRANVKDVYWINPAFFFRGDRILKFKDKVVEANDKTDDQ